MFQDPGPGSHGSGSVTATLSESDNDAVLKTPFIANICFQCSIRAIHNLYILNGVRGFYKI